MKYRTIIATVVAAAVVVGGTAYAATLRDVTARLGGQINDIFRISGELFVTKNLHVNGKIFTGKKVGAKDKAPVIVDDNMKVTGTLQTKGLTVLGTKRYSGTVTTSADGDFVSTMTYPTDCTLYPSYSHSVATHYKAVTVPEAKIAALPAIRVYYKVDANPTAPIPVTYSPSIYPNNNDSWISSG
ncbi:MAG: hypothetical protein HY976_00150, partial [Candidatus Kerfeldbacteria bacterium]|nr:hypothetical protein [Candidatus Kerfeldbacteria bacterium]